jgi:hypothetical protein
MPTDINTATLRDLGKGEFLFIRCGAWVRGRRCGHTGIVLPSTLPRRFDLQARLRDLPKFLHCSKCGKRSAETRISVWHR